MAERTQESSKDEQLEQHRSGNDGEALTTNQGVKVSDTDTASPRGSAARR